MNREEDKFINPITSREKLFNFLSDNGFVAMEDDLNTIEDIIKPRVYPHEIFNPVYQCCKNESIDFGKFLENYSFKDHQDNIEVKLTLIDGNFYWTPDEEGNPISIEDLHKTFIKIKSII